MTLRLTSAFTDGIRRTLSTTGGVVFLLLLSTQLLLLSSINTVAATAGPPELAGELGLTVPVSETVAGALLIGTIVLATLTYVVFARAFTRPRDQLSSFPAPLFTRRIVRATLWMLLGGIVVFVLVMVGFAFLFVPGIVLAACFLFFIFAVGVEDRGPIGAIRRSWDLARGNRLRLIALVVAFGVGSISVSVVPVVFDLAGARLYSDLASALLNSVLFVFVYGIMAAAYLQVTADEA